MDYKNFKKQLINDFQTKRDMLVVHENRNRLELESLFGVKNKGDKLYMRILNEFEYMAFDSARNLIKELCEVKCISSSILERGHGMEININGEKKHIIFTNTPYSSLVAGLRNRIKEDDIPEVVVFLLKDSLESREAVAWFETKIERIDVECILFEDFLELLFGQEEKNAFQEEMADFEQEVHKEIGYQITELCSPYNLEKLKEQLAEEIKSYNYDRIKQQRYEEAKAKGMSAKDLYDNNFGIIKEVFIDDERYKLLLGNSDFAKSYLTSEWLYKKYFSLDELDNTFIVAGFLKSIEQLLWDIIFIVGQGRDINKKANKKEYIKISEESQDEIDNTLGSLQWFLGDWENDALFLDSFGDENKIHFVMGYLRNQISDWRQKYRNGYFHKHNLNDKNKIESIREETYFLYLLILGTIKLNDQQVKRLS